MLGELSDKERREVESMASQHTEIRSELDAIEFALEALAMSKQIQPAPGTYAGIKSRISGSAVPPPQPPSNGSALRSGLFGFLGLIGLALAAFFFYKYNDTQNQYQQLKSESEATQIACDTISRRNIELESQLRILRKTGNQSFFMLGSDLAPQAIAAVYVNPLDQSSFLDVISLPAPPSDKQYQLWALVNGQPVDMGVFDINIEAGSFSEVPYIADAGAYAVTLEPRGGSVNPSLDQLYVISQG